MAGNNNLVAFLFMVIVQLGYAGMNIISKLAMDTGMNPFIHVAYRQLFATISIAPFAYFLERKTRPKLTLSIIFQIFLSSIFGVTVTQITYFVGLKNSTPTIACALLNITPALTFILAVSFGLEKVGFKTEAGQAKLWGTTICVGGALLLSFYHGQIVGIAQSSIHWRYAENAGGKYALTNHSNFFLGPFLLIMSADSFAIWFIVQARLSKKYNAPYSCSAWMCLMASFQCVIVGFCFDHDMSAWALTPIIRATSTIYSGIVCTALAFSLMTWCIGAKGPLYVSVFSPLLLVIVAILSWALLREKLYIGTVVGSILIVIGLYGVLWGKNKEMDKDDDKKEVVHFGAEDELKHTKHDMESQVLEINDTSINNKLTSKVTK